MGPVTPLLAVAKLIQRVESDSVIHWYGTFEGPERQVIEEHGISFTPIQTAKLDRFLSARLWLLPYRLAKAFYQSFTALKRDKPDIIITAGGFTAFPVGMMARLMRIPFIVHQLDYEPGLTNKLLASFAALVTTSFSYHHPPFGKRISTRQIPTPVRFRQNEMTREEALSVYQIDDQRPIVLIVGGGTGAQTLNTAYLTKSEAWQELAQIIHVSGKGKSGGPGSYEFLDARQMQAALILADVIVTRAGMGALSELVYAKKPAVIVPIPHNQQEKNAQVFIDHDAAIILDQQQQGFASMLYGSVSALLKHPEEAKRLTSTYHRIMKTDSGEALFACIHECL